MDSTISAPANVPAAPQSLPHGTEIQYARENSGMTFPSLGFVLRPGETYTVGEDLNGELAHRFVEAGTCRLLGDLRLNDKAPKRVAAVETTAEAIHEESPISSHE